jgi:hypothetical protein
VVMEAICQRANTKAHGAWVPAFAGTTSCVEC